MQALRDALLLLVAAGSCQGRGLKPSKLEGTCPVKKCAGAPRAATASGATAGLLARLHGEAAMPCEDLPVYDVHFTPGHFTCMKCDVHACEGCAVLCDLSSCVGEFYTQECWCSAVGGHEAKADAAPTLILCDPDCAGGLCDNPNYHCGTRGSACQPWWWCGASPPVSFLDRSNAGAQRSAAGSWSESSASSTAAAARSYARRLRDWQAHRNAASGAPHEGGPPVEESQVGMLKFMDGRFECGSAALPPQTRDANTKMWIERGYIVFDQRTCKGSRFNKQCFCWDSFKNLRGEDPETREVMCDEDCRWGACEGQTCGPNAPTPPHKVAPPEPSVVVHRIEYTMAVSMDPVNEPALKDFS